MIYHVTPEELSKDLHTLAHTVSDPIYIMFAGTPCSGKSTVISQLNFLDPKFIYSTDDVVEEIAKFTGRTYSEVFKEEKFSTFKNIADKRLWEATEARMTIIHDQTNMSVASRRKNLALADRHPNMKDYHKVLVFMDTPEKIVMERLKERNKGPKFIPEPIVMNFFKTKEMPTDLEQFHHIFVAR